MRTHLPKETGTEAEESACRFLQEKGLVPVARNVKCRQGEIDLVMREGATTVFVEVRYRRNRRFGTAAETVDRRKQQRLITAAQYYLLRHPKAAMQPCRFDVVAIEGEGTARRFEWIINAFAM